MLMNQLALIPQVNFNSWMSRLLLAVLLAGSFSDTIAQPRADQDSWEPILEEVLVTATKRVVPIEKVPVSVLAVSGKELLQNQINTLEGLSSHMPNVVIGDGELTTAVSIRGIGSQPERSFEQSVGLFVDGVYMPRSRQYREPFMDVRQVEVLRGPQAVLFGINATAGAITVSTNRSRPGDPPVASVEAAYELEYGSPQLTAVLGGAPAESLGLRLAARYHDGGGYFVNEFNGAKEAGSSEKALRLSAVWEPSPATSIDLKAEHGDFEFDGDFGEQFGPLELNQLWLLGLPGTDDGELNWRRNMDSTFYDVLTDPFGGRSGAGISQQYDNIAMTADLEIGPNTLTTTLGYSSLEWDSYMDLDAGPLPIIAGGINEKFDQTSLEIRWASPIGPMFDYMVGIYAHDSKLRNHQPNLFDPTLSFAPGAYGFDHVYLNASFTTKSDLWSIFANASWGLSRNVRLTTGLRYVEEDKNHQRQAQCLPVRNGQIDFQPTTEDTALFKANAGSFLCPTLDGFSSGRDEGYLMPEISLKWNSSENSMWYAKYSESTKSGGFAAAVIVSADAIEYREENVSGFEIGGRFILADRKGRLNLALFDSAIDDLQLNAFDPVSGSGYITNAAKAHSRGIEIDGSWQVNRYWVFSGAVAWLDAEYSSFPEAPCPVSLALAGVASPCNASGKRMPRAPELSFNFNADLDYPLTSGLQFQAGLMLGYTGDYDVDAGLEPAFLQDGYTVVNANLGLEAVDKRWAIALVGTNLTNEAILTDTLPFLSNIGLLQPPRMIWLKAIYRFSANR
jgi:outer membrane receptor protein involved in Fe transport